MSGHAETIDHRLSELCQVVDPAARRALVTAHPELLDGKLVQKLSELVRQHLRINLTHAQSAAEAALTIANELGDAESMGRATRAKANTLWPKGQCKAAVELLEKAVEHFRRASC